MKARVKNYASIAKKAPARIKARGKVKVSAYGGAGGAGYTGGMCGGGFTPFSGPSNNSFVSPSMQQRLLGWASASKLVTISLQSTSFQGFIIGVDGNAFEISVVNPLSSGFIPGSIVTVNFWQVSSVGVVS